MRKKADEENVVILYVYTREPHARQRMMGYDFTGEEQTRSIQERIRNAKRCHGKWEFTIPWIIDDMRGTIQRAYGGLPNSGFLIRSDSVLVYKEPWAKGSNLGAEVSKLHPPAFYLASKKTRETLLKIYEAALRLRRSRKPKGRLAAADELAAFKNPAILPRLGRGLLDKEPKVREKVWKILEGLLEIPPDTFDPAGDEKSRVGAAGGIIRRLKAAEKDYKWDAGKKRFVPTTAKKKIKWLGKSAAKSEEEEGF